VADSKGSACPWPLNLSNRVLREGWGTGMELQPPSPWAALWLLSLSLRAQGEAFYMILLSCRFPGKPLNTVKLKLWKNRVVRMVPGINRAVKHKSAPLALRTVFSQSVSWALYKLDLSITSNWVSGSCLTHSQFSTDVSLLLLGSKFASCFP